MTKADIKWSHYQALKSAYEKLTELKLLSNTDQALLRAIILRICRKLVKEQDGFLS